MEIETKDQVVQNETLEKKVLSQKDAVYEFVTAALAAAEDATIDDVRDSKSKKGKAIRKVVRAQLFDGLKTGLVRLDAKKDDPQLKKYCSGLINNWLNKDPRFSTPKESTESQPVEQ